jgi:hypothetical protein
MVPGSCAEATQGLPRPGTGAPPSRRVPVGKTGIKLHSVQVILLGGKGQYAHVINDTGAPTSGTDTVPSKITQFP